MKIKSEDIGVYVVTIGIPLMFIMIIIAVILHGL
jgi:hypothetical protein